MKKIVLILMLSIMMLGCMTSGNVGKSLTLEKRVDSFNLKEYVIYYDQRGSNNALFGVCYIGHPRLVKLIEKWAGRECLDCQSILLSNVNYMRLINYLA